MGCDIHLFAEGYTADVRGKTLWNRETGNRRWKNIEHWYRDDVWADLRIQGDGGFSRRDLIDGHRDYGLFYLLAGVRGEEEESSWPPIAKPRSRWTTWFFGMRQTRWRSEALTATISPG